MKLKIIYLDKHRLKISFIYITHIEKKYNIIKRYCYNNSKKEDSKQPQCSLKKVKLIEEALRYFKMIP